MSLLHSFYCWGCVAVIALSTACFAVFGRDCWPWVACGWAVLPAANAVAFARVPIRRTVEESQQLSVTALFQSGLFWVLALLMVCAGASEQAMSQWASAFAEKALRVSKTVGDLAGPCFFAVLMGLSRVLHAKLTDGFGWSGISPPARCCVSSATPWLSSWARRPGTCWAAA